MGKTRDLFKKIRETKGTFHAQMGTIKDTFLSPWASLVAQLVKSPPAVWETWVRSQGWEDSLENGKATHSSILTWRIPRTV